MGAKFRQDHRLVYTSERLPILVLPSPGVLQGASQGLKGGAVIGASRNYCVPSEPTQVYRDDIDMGSPCD